jgi:hypothetical protein
MKWLRLVDATLLLLLSIAAIAIAIGHFTGVIARISWLPKPEYEVLLLVLLGAIGFHLGVVHLERLHFQSSFAGGAEQLVAKLAKHAEQLLRGVHGAQVTVFPTSAEQEIYLAKRLDEASVEICDLSWKETLSLHAGLPARVRSQKTYENSIAKAAKRIPYREVFVFSDERRKAKLERRLTENTPGYSCRYFPNPCSIPRLQFVVIDREEIVFASSTYPVLCAIRQAELAQVFQSYYEAIWAAATPLKDGLKTYHNETSKILSSSQNARSEQ